MARLNERQIALLRELAPGAAITAGEDAERFGEEVVPRQARRDLSTLEESDLLRRKGKGKATRYIRTERTWKE